MTAPRSSEQHILAIERPHPKLMTYYVLCCLLAGPFFPILLIPAWFRYHTMRYRFDEDGISMRWGILFRREIVLSYARFQDIHLSSNVVERWLGLARIEIQTASGSAKAEMTIEGLPEFESIRDFLYSRMRGQEDGPRDGGSARAASSGAPGQVSGAAVEEMAGALKELANEVRRLRELLADTRSSAPRSDTGDRQR